MTSSARAEAPPTSLPLDILERIVGTKNLLVSKEDLIPYSFDGTAAMSQMPGCVVFVENAQQVSDLLKEATRLSIAVVTRGSGTGLSGGS